MRIEIFTLFTVFRKVISFIYEKFLFGDRVPLTRINPFDVPTLILTILTIKLDININQIIITKLTHQDYGFQT